MNTAVLLAVVLVALAIGVLAACVLVMQGSGGSSKETLPPHAWYADSPEGSKVGRRPVSEPRVDERGNVSQYRVSPGSSQHESHWDPYAADQSRAHRVQSARRRARQRPAVAKASVNERLLSVGYYAVLGVRADATREEIERAYRRYAAAIHPDRFFDDPRRKREAEEKLKQLNAIMQVLRDPARRAAYDASL